MMEIPTLIHSKLQNEFLLGMGLVGSSMYVESNKSSLSNILGLINLETCGYTSNIEHSQK